MNRTLRANTACLLSALTPFMIAMIGCKSSAKSDTTAANVAGQRDAQSPPAPQNVSSTPGTTQMSVDDIVAPIALYPDQLLAQVLTASTNSQEVLDGGNWLLQNQSLKGDALTNAAKQAGFSPSMQYLTAFPQVVDNMCQQLDWTRQLGQTFQADPKGVMSAIQRKREQAQQVGNLTSSPQMTVSTEKADNGQQYVAIKPADPQVVYVPEYNPVTIYNTAPAPAPATATVTEEKSGVSTGAAVAIGLLSFGAGMAIGSTFHNDDYYPYPAWGYGGVYAAGRPYYPPPYRPAYAGYHPAYGYNPPSNYRWNQYNRNVNVKVDNDKYYGRYNNSARNNVNLNNRPGVGNGNSAINAKNRDAQPNWKGQSAYQGARPNNANQRPGSSMANVNPRANEKPGASMANVNPRNDQKVNRPNVGNNAAVPNRDGSRSAGSLAASRDSSRPASATAANRPSASAEQANRGGDRGYSNSAARPVNASASASRSTPTPQQRQQAQSRAGNNDSAFRKGGSAKSERAASTRGRASVGAAKNRKH